MKLKILADYKKFKGQTALLRVDFNVPLKNGKIADDTRIKAALPTINYLLAKGTKIVLMTHLGRPDGKVVSELSTKVIAVHLSKLLKQPVVHFPDIPVPDMLKRIFNNGKINLVMLENLRFRDFEDKNDPGFARQLSRLGGVYVNDAFAFCHRPTASMVAITRFLPSFAGLQLQTEVENLNKVLESKLKPSLAIIGGVKLETKVKVIKNLIKKMDFILVGGAIANNFISSQGNQVGLSKIDAKELPTAKFLLNKKLIVPCDVVLAPSLEASAKSLIKDSDKIGKQEMILDLGPKTVEQFIDLVKNAKLIVWNGPLGYFEVKKYQSASRAIAKAISRSKAYSVVGGGETGQLLEELKLVKKFSFVSTAGGAMLEFLEGKVLPGIKPLIK
ncbi:MAG: phosphoglycerate kinase [Patescibacteria group bacterium]|jgi:phosphoglycerate kinase